MRFTKEKEKIDAYRTNKSKIKTKFLWLPVNIGGETRWLEKATIDYKVSFGYDLMGVKYYFWESLNFIDNEQVR